MGKLLTDIEGLQLSNNVQKMNVTNANEFKIHKMNDKLNQNNLQIKRAE